MNEKRGKTTKTSNQPSGSFNLRLDNTTYVVGVHFSKTSRETLEDKVKRLIQQDVKAGNF